MNKIAIIALVLVVALVLVGTTSAGNKLIDELEGVLKGNNGISVIEKIYPETFSGTMLADYDSIKLNLQSDKLIFDNDDIQLSDYDFLAIDLVDIDISPGETYTASLQLNCSEDTLSVSNKFTVNGKVTDNESFFYSYSGPYFITGNDSPSSSSEAVAIGTHSYTYLFDLRDISNGNVVLNCYVDGVISTSNSFTDVSSVAVLNSIDYLYGGSLGESYSNVSFNDIYIYGFENASDCALSDYFTDTSLKLTDCQDSMLYYTE